MELILPIIVVVTVLVLGGHEGTNTPSQPALEPESVHDFRDGDDQSGCKAAGRRHEDLTIPYPPRDPSISERCGGDR